MYRIKRILNKTISTKNTYLFGLIVVSFLFLAGYFSYAMFTVSKEKAGVLNIVAGNLQSFITSEDMNNGNRTNSNQLDIEVDAKSYKESIITIANYNAIKAKFNLSYNNLDNIVIGYTTDSTDKLDDDGSVIINNSSDNDENANKKNIKVLIINNNDEKKTISFNSSVGLDNKNIDKTNNTTLITKPYDVEKSSDISKLNANKYIDSLNNYIGSYDLKDKELYIVKSNSEIDNKKLNDLIDPNLIKPIDGYVEFNENGKVDLAYIYYTYNEIDYIDREYIANSSNIKSYKIKESYTFDYDSTKTSNQGYSNFIVPSDGKYLLQVWGAEGGSYDETYYGGLGGYSAGVVELKKDDSLHIYVGGKGSDAVNNTDCGKAGYNGGGTGICKFPDSTGDIYSSGGGGATHIATTTGLLSSLSANKDKILIVAGGGGGLSYQMSGNKPYSGVGGSGGGLKGLDGTNTQGTHLPGLGGSQTVGGAQVYNSDKSSLRGNAGGFGKGGDGIAYSAGGGGGYYGGSASNQSGAGGGSGYLKDTLVDADSYTYGDKDTKKAQTKAVFRCAKKGNGYVIISAIE